MRKKTSRFKGVSRFRNKWRARIGRDTIGIFEQENEAAVAYNEAGRNQLSKTAQCSYCGDEKLLNEFYNDKRKVLKVGSICKTCHGISVRIVSKQKRTGIKDKRLLLGSVLIDKINNQKITQSFAKRIWNEKQAAQNMA